MAIQWIDPDESKAEAEARMSEELKRLNERLFIELSRQGTRQLERLLSKEKIKTLAIETIQKKLAAAIKALGYELQFGGMDEPLIKFNDFYHGLGRVEIPITGGYPGLTRRYRKKKARLLLSTPGYFFFSRRFRKGKKKSVYPVAGAGRPEDSLWNFLEQNAETIASKMLYLYPKAIKFSVTATEAAKTRSGDTMRVGRNSLGRFSSIRQDHHVVVNFPDGIFFPVGSATGYEQRAAGWNTHQSPQKATFLMKLTNPRGRYRPLIPPLLEWYRDSAMPGIMDRFVGHAISGYYDHV